MIKGMRGIMLILLLALSKHSLAVSLGSLTPQSKFAEPLDAVISVDLGTLPSGDFDVRLASPADHEDEGIRFGGFHQGVTVYLSDEDTPQIRLTSTEKLREPIFEFLLEMRWRGGKAQRLYTILPEFVATYSQPSSPASIPATVSLQDDTAVTPSSDAFDSAAVFDTQAQTRQPLAAAKSSGKPEVITTDRYTVLTGDSLWLIAAKMPADLGNLSARIDRLVSANYALITANSPMGIHPGDELVIPSATDPLVPPELLAKFEPQSVAQNSSIVAEADSAQRLMIPEARLRQIRARVRGFKVLRLSAFAGEVKFFGSRPSPVGTAQPLAQPTSTAPASAAATETPELYAAVDIDTVMADSLASQVTAIGQQVDQLLGSPSARSNANNKLADTSVVEESKAISASSSQISSTKAETATNRWWLWGLVVFVIALIAAAFGGWLWYRRRVNREHYDDDLVDDAQKYLNDIEGDWVSESRVADVLDVVDSEGTAEVVEPPVAIAGVDESTSVQSDNALIDDSELTASTNSQGLQQPNDTASKSAGDWPSWDLETEVDLVVDDDTSNTNDTDVLLDSIDDLLEELDLEETVAEDAAAEDELVFESPSVTPISRKPPTRPVSNSIAGDDNALAFELPTQELSTASLSDDEPLKQMLLAGPTKQPKKSAVSLETGRVSSFEDLIMNASASCNAGKHALFYIEIDNLTGIESRVGPLEAEQLVQNLGVRLKDYIGVDQAAQSLMRLRDTTYLYVAGYTLENELVEFGEAMALMVSATDFSPGSIQVDVKVSIGIVPISSHFDSVNDYLICAKKTVEEARALAQDGLEVPQVALFSPQSGAERDDDLVEQIADYIKNDLFEVEYQHLINLTGREEHVINAKLQMSEKLLRASLPDHFLEVAFNSAAGISLDKFMIRSCLEKLMELHNERTDALLLVRVSDNSIVDAEFLGWLKKLVIGSEHFAKRLVLCFDEHFAAAQRVSCWSFCNSLKSSQYAIGMLNFGATGAALDLAVEFDARIVRFDDDKVNLAIKTSDGIGKLSRLANACKERGIETITHTFNSTAIPNIWQFNIESIRSNYILVPDRSNSYEISGT